jgi:mannose-6-phosphate isomerase class I
MNDMNRYDKKPSVNIQGGHTCTTGWPGICQWIREEMDGRRKSKKLLVLECYPGVLQEELVAAITELLPHASLTLTDHLMHPPAHIREVVHPDVTDDRIFGFMTRLTIEKYFDVDKVDMHRNDLAAEPDGLHIVLGTGAAWMHPQPDLLIYADMARWEIQQRMRRKQVSNLGMDNKDTPDWMLLYKQGLFVDWRVCDRLKKETMDRWDLVLDTNTIGSPKMVSGDALREGYRQVIRRPFSVVPFFDPGPWGGQWMRQQFNLDKDAPNYAWCFNCVPEENSLLLNFDGTLFETPAVNLVYHRPEELLGEAVFGRFGDEFPIRFDFLDTMGGGNLSLQVHPTTAYIREHFGLAYTQDESYYMMDAGPGASVYLGLKEDVDPDAMMTELEASKGGSSPFDADRHVASWPAAKHDHFLIPAGTVHCSGKECMVLEISATPFIYTFKLWDWGRLGMDGKPRPINIGHGLKVIRWDRKTAWTGRNLVNRIQKVGEGEGWMEERTGLHEAEFIETRRHWFTRPVFHDTNDGVNVICLVEGDTVLVESPQDAFEPFEVHYAETFIVPARVGTYKISPAGAAGRYATLKAFVRTNA